MDITQYEPYMAISATFEHQGKAVTLVLDIVEGPVVSKNLTC